MMQRLSVYRMLWRAAVAQSHPRAQSFILWGALAVTALMVTIVYADAGIAAAAAWAWCAPFGCCLYAWAWCYLPGALKLNSPANARLVPGMRTRLVELTALIWIVCALALAAGLLALAEQAGLVMLLIASMTLGVGMAIAGLETSALVVVNLSALWLFKDRLPAPVLAWLAHPASMLLVLAGLVPSGALAARAMFPQAGERHWAMLAKRGNWLGKRQPGDVAEFTHLKRWYGALLRRHTARRTPRALLTHALGPEQLGVSAMALGCLVLFIGGLFALAHLGIAADTARALPAIGWLIGSGVLLMFPLHAISAAAAVARTPGEQALVRLAPALPATSSRFNAMLARAQLREGLAVWAMTAGAAMALAALGGARGSALGWQACLCCLTLPALALSLRDHARRSSWGNVFLWLAALGLSGACLAAGGLAYRLLGLPFLASAALTAIVLTLLLVRQRLQLMRSAPFAFPAGRLD